jgi:uncharacterized protein (DUF305 family)
MKNVRNPFNLPLLICLLALSFTACDQGNKTTEETTTTTTEEEATDTASETMMDTTMAGGGMMGHMHKNMEEMRGMRAKMTGDPDYDFALMMTHHHQGGIRMAEEEVANGTDSKMKEMANKTISSNKADIQKLQDFTKTHKPTKGDTASTMRMVNPMNKMMGQMHQQDMSGMNTDQTFAQMMIHHHEMGNEMAREFLKQGKTKEMKQMAQKTMDQQTKEIKEMKAWQQQNPK